MFHEATSFHQDLRSWPDSATQGDDFCSGAICDSNSTSFRPSNAPPSLSPSGLYRSSAPVSGHAPSNLPSGLYPSSTPVSGHFPSHMPSSNRTVFCGDDAEIFTINLHTDFFGEDTSWILEINTRGKYWDMMARNSVPFNGDTFYDEDMCIPKDTCFKFIINDVAQDGLCCNYSKGYYSIFLESKCLASKVCLLILLFFLHFKCH